jgi:hypothetical protein
MNAFYEHHKGSIQFGYRCFDPLLLTGRIQPFEQPERVLGFFNAYREGKRVTKRLLIREMGRAGSLEPPEGDDDESRRNKLWPYFRDAKPNQVVAILKAWEPARILVAIGDKDNDSPHLEYKQRWVNQFNFHVNDPHWGGMFVRMCPYYPFSARVCLNQRHWLATRMSEEGIDFQQFTNAFLKCGNPARLQELADSLTPQDLLSAARSGSRLSPRSSPTGSASTRGVSIVSSSLRWSIATTSFHRRAAVDELTPRLLEMT